MNKRRILVSFGIFFVLNFVFALIPSRVDAANSEVYNSHAQDVAWYGYNAHLEARESRFKIGGSSLNKSKNVYRITVFGACDNSTGGTPGLTASYDGDTKYSLNGTDCNASNDFVFDNVPAEKILTVRKVNGQGHAPFRIQVYSAAESAPFPYVTQLASNNKENPGWNSEDEDAAVAMWGGAGLKQVFHPTCTDRINQKTTYYKWEDADDGGSDNSNKNASLTVYYYDKLGSNQKTDTWTEQQVGGQGKRGSVPIILLPTTHKVEVVWSGVSGQNAIQMVAPYQFDPDITDCQIPPKGQIGAANCKYVIGWAYDPNKPNRDLSVRLTATSANGSSVVTGTANTNNYNNGAGGHPDGHGWKLTPTSPKTLAEVFGDGTKTVTLKLEGHDINEDGSTDAGWTLLTPTETRTKTCVDPDPPPTANIAADCRDGIRITNFGDDNDEGNGVAYVVNAFHRSADTNGNGIMDNGEDADNNGDGYPDNGIRISIGRSDNDVMNFGWPRERLGDNSGWIAVIFVVNVNGSGADEFPGSIYKQANTPQCFSATCNGLSATNASPIAGAPANSVKAGQAFNVSFSARANGARNPMPANLTREDGYVAPLSATIYNNPTFGTSFHPIGYDVLVGNNMATTFSLVAPATIGSYSLTVYADYWGLYGIDTIPAGSPPCTINVNVYQPFRIQPTADNPIGTPDSENPERIDYTTRLSQVEAGNLDGSPYTSQDISSTATSRLMYYNQGSYDNPDFASRTDPGTFGNPAPFSGSWVDTIPGRQFNHGEVDTWQPGDRFCTYISVSPATGWIGPGGDIRDTGTLDDRKCADVQNRPYMRAYGADVFGGGRFGSAGGAGGILAYLKDGSQAAGSANEFAATAIDDISGFASASLRAASAPLPATGLTFANTGTGSPGNFIGARAVPDFYANALKPETTAQGAPGNVQIIAGAYADKGQTLFSSGGSKVPFNTGVGDGVGYNKHHAFFVEGDVVIRNNIVYANTGNYGSLSQIPSFALFVKGNIYIAGNVSQLDGQYIAQPRNDGSGGTIYTCSDVNGNLYDQSGLYSSCNNKLRVNGAFVSQNLRLLRSFKTLSDIPFTYTPPTVSTGISWAKSTVEKDALVAAGATNCVKINEPDELPGGTEWEDNWLCSPSNPSFEWFVSGSNPSNATRECTNWNVIDDNVYWNDDWFCTSRAANLQPEFLIRQSMPSIAGKQCIIIDEPSDDWPGTQGYKDGNYVGSNDSDLVYLCFRGTAGSPASYNYTRETFDSENAAESFRLSPEFFLANPAVRSDGSQTNGKYDYIATLPPIL